MKSPRFLLPFTHGMHMPAIEQAVSLARDRYATLVLASLLYVPYHQREKKVRLELVQQSQDFFECVSGRAAKYDVPIEKIEVVTSSIPESIKTLTWKHQCDGVIVFTGEKGSMFLPIDAVKAVSTIITCKLYSFYFGRGKLCLLTRLLTVIFVPHL